MATPIPNTTAYPEIPDKLYFRIGEVSRLAGVKAYVLRYWETEFPNIGPKKSGSNHRLYRRKDVELILEIKHLLYEKRYTIEGARKHMQDQSRGQSRVETRPLAKPAQAVSALANPMAMAIGATSVPVQAGSLGSAPAITAGGAPTAIVAAAGGGSTPSGAGTGTATATTSASKTKASAAAKAQPALSADVVGSIRRELLSLLDLLSH